jgi:hypothetical protein
VTFGIAAIGSELTTDNALTRPDLTCSAAAPTPTTDAGGAHLDCAGALLGVFDEILESFPGRFRTHHDDADAAGEDIDSVELAVVDLGEAEHLVELRVLGAVEEVVAVRRT